VKGWLKGGGGSAANADHVEQNQREEGCRRGHAPAAMVPALGAPRSPFTSFTSTWTSEPPDTSCTR
jgi:hypothetical protein